MPARKKPRSALDRIVEVITGFMATPISDETDEIAKGAAKKRSPARKKRAAASGAKKKAGAAKKKAGAAKKKSGAAKKKRAARK